MKIRFIDLFAGMGGFRVAATQVFKRNRLESECVFSCEIDKYAQKTYSANFGETPHGDITKISPAEIPNHDLLFAGFPCQPFSIIGKGDGFEDDRGSLFFNIAEILKEKSPRAFILENVKRLVSHDKGRTLSRILKDLRDLGYWVDYKVINALDYGLPQKRERVIIVGFNEPIAFNWPPKRGKYIELSEILEKRVDKKYFASDHIARKRKESHTPASSPSIWHENKSGNISSHPYSCALRAGASHNYLLVNGERRLTPREMLRLQGMPDSFKVVVPDTQLRKQAGNAVPVNIISAVLESLLPRLIQSREKDKMPSTNTLNGGFHNSWVS